MEDQGTSNLVAKIANNAMNCAMQIMPDASTVYVASDSVEPIEYIAKSHCFSCQDGLYKEGQILCRWSHH